MAGGFGQGRKSGAPGLDIERIDKATGEIHLYVLKSGTVTRNSDILAALKRNARKAEALLKQSKAAKPVVANYAILAGNLSSTFEDGIRRPSSAEVWSEMTGLPVPEALELALAVAAEAGRLVKPKASEHVEALKTLVADYIAKRDTSGAVDWEFMRNATFRIRALGWTRIKSVISGRSTS
jgi:hypothetical protein